MDEEIWVPIPEFSNYMVSNHGQIYNVKFKRIMRPSLNNFGHLKISLKGDGTDERFTRSIAFMVAEAFVDPPNRMCDQVIILDGNFENVQETNLAWRPRWYAWKYTRQLKLAQPIYYENLVVRNITDNIYYNSIIEAGMLEGLLFDDIWRSTYTGSPIFPYGSVWEIVERV